MEQTAHLLAVLSGQPPGLTQGPRFVLSDFTLPAELVRQRPDTLAAEALLQAASAQIGVTVAKHYPQITLSAYLGSQALTAASLFSGGSLVWGLAGQLAQPIFKPGLQAETRAAEAGFDAASANYRETVLQGLRQVADALRALDHDAQALQAQTEADGAARQFATLAERQYALGSADYLQLLAVQQKEQQARLIDTASLFQALGGGLRASSRLTSSPV